MADTFPAWVREQAESLADSIPLADDVGYSSFADGCNVCPTEFVDGKPVRQRIEPRGKWMCCVKCGGSYGEVSDVAGLMAMPEAEVDAELRRLGIDPDEAARQGKAAVEGALEAIRAHKDGSSAGGVGGAAK